MIMGIPGAVAPVVFGGKIRAVLAYLDREKMQARGLSPLDVMKALDNSNVFLPSRRRQVRRHRLRPRLELDVSRRRGDGGHPARGTSRAARVYLRRRGHAQGRQLHPDQRRPGQRQAARSTSRSSASSAPARWGRRRRSSSQLQDFAEPADAAGDRPQAGHGPVGLRAAARSRPWCRKGVLGRDPLLAGDPAVPGRDADDGDRHHDAADLGPGGVGGACTSPGRRST